MNVRGVRVCISMVLFLLTAPDLHAGWKISGIDRTDSPYIRFHGDKAAYAKDDDLYFYEMSANDPTAVTQDGNNRVDIPLAFEEGVVWFCSYTRETPPDYQLLRHTVESGRTDLLYTTEFPISLTSASVDAGRIAVKIGNEWWIWNQGQMGQVTFTGGVPAKQYPSLSNDFLLWREGLEEIFLTSALTLESILLTQEGVQNGSPALHGQHAAWVKQTGDRYEIILYRIHSGEFETIDESGEETQIQLHLDAGQLLFLKKSEDSWFVMRYHLSTRTLQTLYETSLPLEAPSLHGDDLFLIVRNCITGMCLELNTVNLASGTLTPITRYGSASYVCTYDVGPVGVVFSRFLATDPYNMDILEARESPGLTCETPPRTQGKSAIVEFALLLASVLLAKSGILTYLKAKSFCYESLRRVQIYSQQAAKCNARQGRGSPLPDRRRTVRRPLHGQTPRGAAGRGRSGR